LELKGEPVYPAGIQGRSVIIEKIKRNFPMMAQQAFLYERIVTSPAAGHENTVICPGFPVMQNTSNDLAHSAQGIWINDAQRASQHHRQICTGTFLLAETGLLDGRVTTTNWQFAEIFKRQYPKVNLQVDRILTAGNGLYCTGAATAFLNLCLHLIEKYGSPDLASRCAKGLLVDADRQRQSPYIVYDFWKNHSDNEITWKVGYEDINSFRRLFIKHTGLSPKRYRSKFSRSPEAPSQVF
jgi:transcriptional regulator GlxA family with amidase domain